MLAKRDSEQRKAEQLAGYLAGTGTLAEQFYSTTDLTMALAILLDRKVSEDDIVSGVRRILRSRDHHFDDVNLVRRALKVMREGETLFGTLMAVRQARMRRKIRRRR